MKIKGMHNSPLISVLMPAFNAAEYIGDAIRSILSQSFTNFEFIIINDGSSDQTRSIIESFNDKRIRLHNQQNLGIAKALNVGLALARTDLIARFDADDIALPDRLQKQWQAFEQDAELVVAGSAVDYIDEAGQHVFTWNPPASAHHSILGLQKTVCPFIHSSVMFRKDPILDMGGYNEHAHSFEDHLLWLQVRNRGRLLNTTEPLIKVRLNANSITIDERWRPARFRKIKNDVLNRGHITSVEGNKIKKIIERQDRKQFKHGAYYALLGKKYLWNNYHPEKARLNFRKAITYNPFYAMGYGLFAATFLPKKIISAFYKSYKTVQ
jgi:glycosyltransferase involved in cell wall biosynthesis